MANLSMSKMLSAMLLTIFIISRSSKQGFSFILRPPSLFTTAPTKFALTAVTPVITETATRKGSKIHPKIIQGGMGVRISSWALARSVSKRDGLGVISGTALDVIFVRTLQDGDPGGHFRRALATFPNQPMAQRAIDKYFIRGGKPPSKPYRSLPLWSMSPPSELIEATILGNYCEVWLARHNDDGSPTGGVIGVNLLTKVALPTIHSLYGAMLAGVDYVIMGAGIPNKIPGILDALAEGKDCSLPIDVNGASEENENFAVNFSPQKFWKDSEMSYIAQKPLRRPAFLPIVSSTTLAQSLLKRSNGAGPTRGIDGFVVELHTAGGHNAPPRGWHFEPNEAKGLNELGEPTYGEKDLVDIKTFCKFANGLPFWFAGGYGKKWKLREVLEGGGNGVQVGTMFALSQESGMNSTIKQKILSELAMNHTLNVFTDPAASPTGFPFKVLQIDSNLVSTLSDHEVYDSRPRACNLGYLRSPYLKPNGEVGYRCPAEPVKDFISKGGDEASTVGRKCLCNALCADAGFPQVRVSLNNHTGERRVFLEPGLITIGDDIDECKSLLKQDVGGQWTYTADDVIDYLLSDCEAITDVDHTT